VAEHHAGQRLDLDVAQRVALDLREVAHLRLRELDVVDRLLRQSMSSSMPRRRARWRARTASTKSISAACAT
jgi:hypothetical protein